jgi:hypothetical protein
MDRITHRWSMMMKKGRFPRLGNHSSFNFQFVLSVHDNSELSDFSSRRSDLSFVRLICHGYACLSPHLVLRLHSSGHLCAVHYCDIHIGTTVEFSLVSPSIFYHYSSHGHVSHVHQVESSLGGAEQTWNVFIVLRL